MTENEIGTQIVDAALEIHRTLGPDLLESVYQVALAHDFVARGLEVERQIGIPIRYDSIAFDEGFRADLIVERRRIVEIKSAEAVTNAPQKNSWLTCASPA